MFFLKVLLMWCYVSYWRILIRMLLKIFSNTILHNSLTWYIQRVVWPKLSLSLFDQTSFFFLNALLWCFSWVLVWLLLLWSVVVSILNPVVPVLFFVVFLFFFFLFFFLFFFFFFCFFFCLGIVIRILTCVTPSCDFGICAFGGFDHVS